MNRRGEIERVILNDRRLTKRDLDVLWPLVHRAHNDTGEVLARYAPSLRTLAFEARCSLAAVKRRLRNLEERGWIERDRGGNGAGDKTAYRFRVPSEPLPSEPLKGLISSGPEGAHLNGDKGLTTSRGQYEGVVMEPENEEENGHFRAAPRTNFERPSLAFYDEPECAAADCNALPRHGLLTCFDHAHDEFTHRQEREVRS